MTPLTDDPIMMGLFLLAGHALADGPLQTGFMAEAKNPNSVTGKNLWIMAVFGHSVLHGALVGLITGWSLLAVGEVLAHSLIDGYKTKTRKISHAVDQLLHVGCKVVWFGAMMLFQ